MEVSDLFTHHGQDCFFLFLLYLLYLLSKALFCLSFTLIETWNAGQ